MAVGLARIGIDAASARSRVRRGSNNGIRQMHEAGGGGAARARTEAEAEAEAEEEAEAEAEAFLVRSTNEDKVNTYGMPERCATDERDSFESVSSTCAQTPTEARASCAPHEYKEMSIRLGLGECQCQRADRTRVRLDSASARNLP